MPWTYSERTKDTETLEIPVSHLMHEDLRRFSSLRVESGLYNIGQVLWENALRYFDDHPFLVKPSDQPILRGWLDEFGAWSIVELRRMTDLETNALLLQFIAGDIREMVKYYPDPDAYAAAQERGSIGCSLHKSGLGWYYTIDCFEPLNQEAEDQPIAVPPVVSAPVDFCRDPSHPGRAVPCGIGPGGGTFQYCDICKAEKG